MTPGCIFTPLVNLATIYRLAIIVRASLRDAGCAAGEYAVPKLLIEKECNQWQMRNS